jgi:hypothetical protein
MTLEFRVQLAATHVTPNSVSLPALAEFWVMSGASCRRRQGAATIISHIWALFSVVARFPRQAGVKTTKDNSLLAAGGVFV